MTFPHQKRYWRSFRVAQRHVAAIVDVAQREQARHRALARRRFQQRDRGSAVARHALAVAQQQSEVVLGGRQIGIGRFAIPLGRLGRVALDDEAALASVHFGDLERVAEPPGWSQTTFLDGAKSGGALLDLLGARAPLEELINRALPAELPLWRLPVQQMGFAPEHRAFAGTFSLRAEQLIGLVETIGAELARCGFRRLVLLNSHGGNVPVIDLVARDIRIETGLMVFPLGMQRLP